METETETARTIFRALAGLVGFTRENFGGNTVLLVRRGRHYVDTLATAGDSFPPETETETAVMLRHTAESFARWESGDDTAELIAVYRGRARDLLAID